MKGRKNKLYEFGIESEVEIEVADILVNLGAIIMESESRYIDNTNPPLAWGGKRKRSIPPSQGNNNKVKTEEAAASPNTPLCFAPSECDEKPKGLLPGQTCSNNKKGSKRRHVSHTRKEWLEIIDGLTKRRELLTKEVDVVRGFYKKLKTYNAVLKAKKDEIIKCHIKKENPPLITNRGLKMVGIKLEQQEQQYPVCVFPHQQQPSFTSPFKVNYYLNGGSGILSSTSGLKLGMVNPRGIPDLNVAYGVEETFGIIVEPTQNRRYLAAQARKRRMITLKNKKMKISLADNNKRRL